MTLVELFFSVSFWAWLCVFGVGVVFCFLLFWGLRRLFQRGMHPEEEEEHKTLTWGQRTKAKMGRFFARYGYIPHDSLSRSFVNALNVLQNVVGGRGYRYRLPWFMVIGQEGSGKTALLESLRLPLPVGAPSWNDRSSTCGWWFFDHGVVLDVRGELVLEQDSMDSREEEWRLLLDLLANHRPNRPLDGIVLTVSCVDLLTRDVDDLAARAEAIYGKLWQAQRVLGLKLPVFIVVTHCDRVTGFSSFCNEIPPENRDDIFGWSNPYPLETAYKTTWVDELFQQVTEQLIHLQQEIFNYGKVYAERDGLLLFPREFQKLHKPLAIYLNRLFQSNNFHENFFFRGVFFSGDSLTNTNTDSLLTQTLEASFDMALRPTDSQNLPEKAGEFGVTREQRALYFTTALFREKVFLEKGLVQFVRQRLLANTQVLRLSQIGVLLLTCAGLLGLLHAYHKLMETRSIILPSVNRIGYAIQRSLTDHTRSATDHTFFQQQAQLILQAMTDIRAERLFSLFIPASWLSPLDNRIQKVMTVAYEVVILRAIADKLREGVDAAISGNLPAIKELTAVSERINPTQSLSFLELQQYLEELANYQGLIVKYNDLQDSVSLQDFGIIVEKLFGTVLPVEFYHDVNGIYRKALGESHIQPIGFYDYSTRATERLNRLIAQFFDGGLNPKRLTPQMMRLHTALQEFTQAKTSYSVEQLRELVQTLSQTINLFTSPQAQWLLKEVFSPGPTFDAAVNKMASSNFFDPSTADNFLKACAQSFEKFRGVLASYRSPLTGAMFSLDSGESSFISQAILNLQGFLNLLLAQPFMSVVDSSLIQTSVPPNTILVWNYSMLLDASRLMKSFENFFNNKLSSLPTDMGEILRFICLKGLRKTMGLKIAAAQDFMALDKGGATTAPEEALLPEVQNLRAITPVLVQLFHGLKSAGATGVHGKLQQAIQNQCLSLLEKIDSIFESDGPYEVRLDSVASWRGSKGQFFPTFGVSGPDELRNHLALQRQRMQYLAKEFAEPAVEILEKIFENDAVQEPGVLKKWRDILNQLSLYNRKGASTLRTLEEFISSDLPSMNLETCPLVLDLSKTDISDFFMERLQDIRTAFSKQCTTLNTKASESAYVKIANYFNAHLAGRYPFVPKGFTNYPDADLADVSGFYALFDDEGPYAQELLRSRVKKQPCLRKALLFLQQMQKLRGFFRPLVAPGNSGNEPAIPFQIQFRTNKAKETNANQLISWTVKIGDETYDFAQGKAMARWPYNNKIIVQMTWALGSPYRPVSTKEQPALTVGPLTATYTYSGCWAFLRLLDMQKAAPSDFKGNVDSNPTTLRFDVPTVPKDPIYPETDSEDTPPPPEPGNTRLFMSLKLVKPLPNGIRNFNLPVPFPTTAPSMSQNEAPDAAGKGPIQKPEVDLSPPPCTTASSCGAKASVAPKKKPRKTNPRARPPKEDKDEGC